MRSNADIKNAMQKLTDAQPDLLHFVSGALISCPDDVWDVVQDINYTLISHIDIYQPDKPFLPWALKVAKNKIIDFRRKRGRDRLVFDEQMLDLYAETAAAPDGGDETYARRVKQLHACMERLTPAQRALLDLHYFKDLSLNQIARDQGKEPSTLRVLVFRVRKILYDCMKRLCRLNQGEVSLPESKNSFEDRLCRLVDEPRPDNRETRELFTELREDPDRMSAYAEQVAIHFMLRDEAKNRQPQPAAEPRAAAPFPWLRFAAGIALLLTGLGWAGMKFLTAAPAPGAAISAVVPPPPTLAGKEPAVITVAVARAAVPVRPSALAATSAPPAEITASATVVADAVVSVKTLPEKKVEEGVVTNMNKLTASVSAAVVAATFTASASDTAWLYAADGDWNIAANWTLGVPTRDNPAFLTNTAASYTVSLTNTDASAVITNLTVANAGGNTTTLVIGTALTADSGLLNFGAGARINLVTNGVLDYLDAATNYVFGRGQLKLTGGAELQIDGGALLATNQTSHFVIGDTGGSAISRLVMTSGSMCFTNKGSLYTYENLLINQGGSLEASGGFICAKTLPWYADAFQLTKGAINLSGDAVLLLTNNMSRNWSGDLTLSEHASASFGVLNFVGRTDWTNHIALSGNASLSLGKDDNGPFQMGSPGTGAGSGATYVSVQDQARLTLQSKLGIGLSQGYGEMDIGNGTVVCAGCWVGCAMHYPTYGSSTGLVEMTGGTLYSAHAMILYNYYGMEEASARSVGIPFIGFLVGANVNAVATPGTTLGLFNFSGGTISNDIGRILIGAGATACGRFVQTGGAFHQTYRRNNGNYNALGNSTIIGACGGDGTYIISNGTFNTDWHVCVGGLSTNEWYADNRNDGIPAQSLMVARGTGLLDIEGGAFTMKTNQADLIIGACGSGTVKIGPAGTCLAQNIILTNGTDAAISCTLGANGLGTLQAAKKLIVYGAAKLTVDATAYTGSESWIPLIRCASREGSFEAANIVVQNGKGTVVQDHDGTGTVFLHLPHGTIFTIKGGD